MPKFRIMDHTGHTTEVYDKADKVTVAKAEKRFRELTGKGFRAVEGKPGEEKLSKTFNPEAEDVLFIPQLQGG